MATLPDMTLETIVEKTKKMLGKNYRESEAIESNETTVTSGDEELEIDTTDLEEVCTMVIREAAEWTNRFKEEQLQEVMNECWPVIVRCSCVAYLNRGAEGLGSQSELGQQNVYNDWIKLMHQQITNRRHVI